MPDRVPDPHAGQSTQQGAALLPETVPADAVPRDPREIQFDLVHVARRVYRLRWTIVATTLLGIAIGVALGFVEKPYYMAQALFLPPKSATDTMSIGSAVFGGGGSEDSDTYLGLLGSESVANDVIEHTHLMQEFKTKTMTDTRIVLSQIASFSVSKNTLIQIQVRNGDPKLAASIANAYLNALYRLNGRMVNSGSKNRRDFYEDQLQEQKRSLSDAEQALERSQERTGVVLPGGEAQANIGVVVGLQAQIGDLQARLAALLTGATEQNPQVIQLRRQIGQLQSQLAQEQGSSRSPGLATNSQLPSLTLENTQKTQEVSRQAATYDALLQQYERARLAAIDPGPQLEVIDQATVPERKAGPSRRSLATLWTFLGFIAGLVYVLGAVPLRRFLRLLREPESTLGR